MDARFRWGFVGVEGLNEFQEGTCDSTRLFGIGAPKCRLSAWRQIQRSTPILSIFFLHPYLELGCPQPKVCIVKLHLQGVVPEVVAGCIAVALLPAQKCFHTLTLPRLLGLIIICISRTMGAHRVSPLPIFKAFPSFCQGEAWGLHQPNPGPDSYSITIPCARIFHAIEWSSG